MKVLNLVNPDKTHIKYDIVRFSDSQIQFTLTDLKDLSYGFEEVLIISRMSWNDLQVIIAATAALRRQFTQNIFLYVPYFLGARSDRQFSGGGSNYIKQVIAPIINSLNFREVLVIDPHSDVLEACINNYTKNDNWELVNWSLEDLYQDNNTGNNFVLVSPDAGALKKIYNVAELIHTEYGFVPEIVVASKHRDIATGKILSTEVPLTMAHAKRDFIICDDICDGGRTFIEIAKKIKETFPDANIYLIVTHGIFSQGFTELGKWFTCIYTTNSFRDINRDTIIEDTWKLRGFPASDASVDLIKQLNVFE